MFQIEEVLTCRGFLCNKIYLEQVWACLGAGPCMGGLLGWTLERGGLGSGPCAMKPPAPSNNVSRMTDRWKPPVPSNNVSRMTDRWTGLKTLLSHNFIAGGNKLFEILDLSGTQCVPYFRMKICTTEPVGLFLECFLPNALCPVHKVHERNQVMWDRHIKYWTKMWNQNITTWFPGSLLT